MTPNQAELRNQLLDLVEWVIIEADSEERADIYAISDSTEVQRMIDQILDQFAALETK
jgi:hypothetical protein